MTIGTPVSIGSVQNKTSEATTSLTTTAAVPAGAVIALCMSYDADGTISSISDGTNSYGSGSSDGNLTASSSGGTSNADIRGRVVYQENAGALSAGSTISINWGTQPAAKAISAFYITGLLTSGVKDQSARAWSSSDGTSPTVTTGTTTQADEITIGMVATEGPSGDTFTQAASPAYGTPPVRVGTTGGSQTSNATVAGGYFIETATGAKTYNPTLGTARAWVAIIVTFKGASGATYDNSISLGASGGLSLSALLGAAGVLSLGAVAGINDAVLGDLVASSSFNVGAGMIEAGTLTMDAAFSAGVSAGISDFGGFTLDGTFSLGASAGQSNAAGLAIGGAIALSSAAALIGAASLDALGAATLATQAGLGVSSAGSSLGAALNLANQAGLGANTILDAFPVISLDAVQTLAAFGGLDAAAALALINQTGIAARTGLIASAAAALGVSVSLVDAGDLAGLDVSPGFVVALDALANGIDVTLEAAIALSGGDARASDAAAEDEGANSVGIDDDDVTHLETSEWPTQ